MPSRELTRRQGSALAVRGERRLARTRREAQVPAQFAAAKIEAAAFATHVALTHATMLAAAEERAIRYAPLGEPRYKAINDAFAGYCCQELSLLAFK